MKIFFPFFVLLFWGLAASSVSFAEEGKQPPPKRMKKKKSTDQTGQIWMPPYVETPKLDLPSNLKHRKNLPSPKSRKASSKQLKKLQSLKKNTFKPVLGSADAPAM